MTRGERTGDVCDVVSAIPSGPRLAVDVRAGIEQSLTGSGMATCGREHEGRPCLEVDVVDPHGGGDQAGMRHIPERRSMLQPDSALSPVAANDAAMITSTQTLTGMGRSLPARNGRRTRFASGWPWNSSAVMRVSR